MPPPLTDTELQARRADAERVRYLLDHFWGGNQNRMARELAASQSIVSKIIRAERLPGRKFMEKLARHPGINANWVMRGEGAPVTFLRKGTLPIARSILPGWPERCAELLTGEWHPVAEAHERPSRYWYRVSPDCRLATSGMLSILAGDLLLLDADQQVWPTNLERCQGQLVGVRLQRELAPSYEIGLLVLGELGLVLELFGEIAFLASQQSTAQAEPQPAKPVSSPDRRIEPFEVGRPKRKVRGPFRKRPAEEEGVQPGSPQTSSPESMERTPTEPILDPRPEPLRLQFTLLDLVALRVYMVRP